MIVVDEAGRLSEPTLDLATCNWPHTPTLIVGDPVQFGPVVPELREVLEYDGERIWSDTFSPQMCLSRLHRMRANDAADIKLTVNWRSIGSVSSFPMAHLYNGEMTIAEPHQRNTAAVREVLQYVQNFTHSRASSMILDVGNHSKPVQLGTSWVNEPMARLSVEVAVELAKIGVPRHCDVHLPQPRRANVLIITPYLQQKLLIQRLLKNILPSEVHPDLIQVRTVDDSPSFQASFVVNDMPRTKSAGFQGDTERMSVSTTRAEYFMVTIMKADSVHTHENLRPFVRHVQSSEGVVQLKPEALRWCTKCGGLGGHKREDCKPLCNICPADKRKHSGRKCPNHQERPAPLFTNERDPLIDNINRGAFRFVVPVDKATSALASDPIHTTPDISYNQDQGKQDGCVANENNTWGPGGTDGTAGETADGTNTWGTGGTDGTAGATADGTDPWGTANSGGTSSWGNEAEAVMSEDLVLW